MHTHIYIEDVHSFMQGMKKSTFMNKKEITI